MSATKKTKKKKITRRLGAERTRPASRKAAKAGPAPTATLETFVADAAVSFDVEISLEPVGPISTRGEVGQVTTVRIPGVRVGRWQHELDRGDWWYQFRTQGTGAFTLGVSIDGGQRSQVQPFTAPTSTLYRFRVG